MGIRIPFRSLPYYKKAAAKVVDHLEDIVVPSSVTARSIRVSQTGGTQERVYLDPLNKTNVEQKIDCMAHAYAKLTTHKISIDFSKPTSFQKKKIEQMREKRGQ